MAEIIWTTPSPIWLDSARGLGSPGFEVPWLVESASDRFMNDFLDLLAGSTPGKRASDLANQGATLTDGALKLYQPFHGRYYLVTGSLVCRRVSWPDRHVAVEDGERTSFVLRRRLTGGAEQAWTTDDEGTGWRGVAEDQVLAGEERLPLHRAPVCKGVAPGPIADGFGLSSCSHRAIYFGYVPVASREKYQVPSTGLVAALTTAISDGDEIDPRLDELNEQVLHPWEDLRSQTPGDDALLAASLYVLLGLCSLIERRLPAIAKALTDGPDDLSGAAKTLYDRLANIELTGAISGGAKLTDVLAQLRPSLPLLQGIGEAPTETYDASKPAWSTSSTPAIGTYLASMEMGDTSPPNNSLAKDVFDAIDELKEPYTPPEELASLLVGEVDTPADGDSYVLRLVYERGACPPIVSQATPAFTLAKALDPTAPARRVRIELPDLKDLPKFKRGIGMQMSPSLRGVMDRVNKDMLEGDGLTGNDPGWQLGMICSFSIQIVTLVAFVVMFIFLITLNLVFWWLPFLKICFPVPVKKS